jgi:undecaprenyl-diphosphatase
MEIKGQKEMVAPPKPVPAKAGMEALKANGARNRRAYVLGAALFILIEYLLILFVDRPVALAARALDTTNHGLIDFFRFYTDLGLGKWYEWPSGVALLIALLVLWRAPMAEIRKKRVRVFSHKMGFFFAATAGAGLLTDVLKYAIGRPRPKFLFLNGSFAPQPFTHGFDWHSFPSGHTTTSFAVATSLCLLFPKGRFFFMAYAALVGLSRIMVTAHYPSDVLAGAVVGLFFTLGVSRFFKLSETIKG